MVGTDVSDHRRSHSLSIRICSDTLALRGAGRGPVVGREQGGDERLERGEIASYVRGRDQRRQGEVLCILEDPDGVEPRAFSLPVST